MNDNKLDKFKELMGGMAELVLGRAEQTDKAAEEAGATFKAIGEWSEADLKAFIQKCMGDVGTKQTDPAEPDADDKNKKAAKEAAREAAVTHTLTAIQTSLKGLQENDEKIASALGQLGKMQTASAEAIKALQGDLPKSLASLKRSAAMDNIIPETVAAQAAPSLKRDNSFGDFLSFAVTGGSANGGKPPAG